MSKTSVFKNPSTLFEIPLSCYPCSSPEIRDESHSFYTIRHKNPFILDSFISFWRYFLLFRSIYLFCCHTKFDTVVTIIRYWIKSKQGIKHKFYPYFVTNYYYYICPFFVQNFCKIRTSFAKWIKRYILGEK